MAEDIYLKRDEQVRLKCEETMRSVSISKVFVINKLSLFQRLLLSLIFGLLMIIPLHYIGLTFSGDAYYHTLSSIFQGLFSILALAGIFIIFKIGELSKKNAEYASEIKDVIPRLCSCMGRNDLYGGMLLDLERRNMREYEEKMKTLEIEIDSEKDHLADSGYTWTKSVYCSCIEKGRHISQNIELCSEILEFFKLPLIKGMLVIVFVLYFLSMPNFNSSIFPFHIPMGIVIGASVIFTIIVILEITWVIYYSMRSERVPMDFWSEVNNFWMAVTRKHRN